MIWAIIEALADPKAWAIRIDRSGVIHIEEIASLEARGARIVDIKTPGCIQPGM